MAANSKIEWTDATWNPIIGCSVVSPGCTNCYAMRLAGTRLRCSDPATHHSHLPAQFWQDGELVFWPRVRDTPAIGVRRVGRAAAGRLLDGREHNAFPEPRR